MRYVRLTVELLERDAERAVFEATLGEAETAGRVVLVVGEAGIGKTRLVETVLGAARRARVLWGACDPLVTPRALGPVQDVARQAGGALAAAVAEAAPRRERVLAALLDELSAPRTVLVVEDVHWIDEASLDLLVLLVRRLGRAPGCVVLTCRPEGLGPRGDVRRVLAAIPRDLVRVIEPAPLSARAVRELTRAGGHDPAELHRVTGGNPFFVTEVLAAPPGAGVPASVREAMALRVAEMPPASLAVLEVTAVVPGAASLRLVGDTVGAEPEAIDACVRAGILVLEGDGVAFRHYLACCGFSAEMGVLHKRGVERAVLAALEAQGDAEPAQLVHHARAAADPVAIRRLAPVAARAASAAGSHRQALEHWEAALAAAHELDELRLDVEALEGVAAEAFYCNRTQRAHEIRATLLTHFLTAGDRLRTGETLRWISRLHWWSGDGAQAIGYADRAIAMLEQLPEGRELAMALSARSQLAMLADRNEHAIALGTRAGDLARRLGDRETLAHAMTNVGSALNAEGSDRGRAKLEEAFALAVELGAHEHAVRAIGNLATDTLNKAPGDPHVAGDLERAIAFSTQHDLDGYTQYFLGYRSALRLLRGDWASAEADVGASLAFGEQRSVSVCPALTTLAQLHTRRGSPQAVRTLEAAWDRAVLTGELQRIAPAAAARAEHAWLQGDAESVEAVTREPYALALECQNPYLRGSLACWRWRAGALDATPGGIAEPHARALHGDWAGAAAAWTALAFPYEAALALCDGDDEDALLTALARFDALGATQTALRLRRRLREQGVRRVPRGPRTATRADVDGLTPRQAEVLGQLRLGASNADIAARLVISEKTVDHHVSAVLAKLAVHSRHEAAALAPRGP